MPSMSTIGPGRHNVARDCRELEANFGDNPFNKSFNETYF